MLYMKCICFSVQYKILSFPPEYFSFIKYFLKNCRVLDNYKTKLIERSKTLSLISYHFHYSIISCGLQICRFYKMELLHRYFFKEKLQYENTANIKYNLFQKDNYQNRIHHRCFLGNNPLATISSPRSSRNYLCWSHFIIKTQDQDYIQHPKSSGDCGFYYQTCKY